MHQHDNHLIEVGPVRVRVEHLAEYLDVLRRTNRLEFFSCESMESLLSAIQLVQARGEFLHPVTVSLLTSDVAVLDCTDDTHSYRRVS